MWLTPPADLLISQDEVHIWRACLRISSEKLIHLRSILAPDELERAGRFRFDKDRARFTAARGILRVLLGRYLDAEPRTVKLRYSEHGKPGVENLSFNLSHSHEAALYAVTRSRALGVDLEYIRHGFAWEPVARDFFLPQEVAAIWRMPPPLRARSFFALWTRKEARMKAAGEGLGGPAALPAPFDCFRVTKFKVHPEYAAAVAVEGRGCRLATWDFQ